MEYLKNKANNVLQKVATPFMGVLKESKFLEKGVLTPEEFILAGDQLTHKCPTWSWESGTDKLRNANLPQERQFLITRGIPCTRRIKQLQKQDEETKERDVEDGWVETDNPNLHGGKGGAGAAAMDIDDMQDIDGGAGAEEEGEAADMDELMKQDDKKDDDNVFSKYIVRNQEDDEDLVHKNRTYDLSITYDFFYQTPRLWLIGYSETGQVLSESEIFEDIMADYAKKTVTLEPHPHLGVKQASIHPCNHANVMKKIIDTIISNGGTPQVHQSLFVFLKFISSVVPTIEYDFTIDLELE